MQKLYHPANGPARKRWPPLRPVAGQVYVIMSSSCANLTAGRSNHSFLSIHRPAQWLLLLIAHLYQQLAVPSVSSALQSASAVVIEITWEIRCFLSPHNAFGGLSADSSACRHLHHDQDQSTSREPGVHAISKKHCFSNHLINELKNSSDVKDMKTYVTHQHVSQKKKLAGSSACAGLHHHTTVIIFRLLMVSRWRWLIAGDCAHMHTMNPFEY